VTKRLLILVGGVMACWLLLALPARRLGAGEDAVIQSGLAALLCLVPAVLVMVWAGWAFRQNAEHQTYVVLGGGGLRLFFVLGAALFLTEITGLYRGQSAFLIWVGIFYLFTLALEVGLLVTALAKKST
jgi:hypothetical protein